MKKFLALMCILCLLLTGCRKPTMDISSLLHPPKLNKENTKLLDSINKFTPKNKKFLYPIKNDVSTAYKYDVNNDGKSEAFVFYTSNNDMITHVLVLSPTESDYNSEESEWTKYAEITKEGCDIDFVAFENIFSPDYLDLVIGWKLYNNNETKGLSIYSQKDNFKEIFTDAYNNVAIKDITGDKLKEIFTLSIDNSVAKIIGKKNNTVKEFHRLPLNIKTKDATYINFSTEKDNNCAIIVDYIMPENKLTTKIFTFDASSNTLCEEEKDSSFLSSDIPIKSYDIDKDGRVEIFFNYKIPYASAETSEPNSPCFAAVFEFTKEKGLQLDYHCIINEQDGYAFQIPEELSDKLSFLYDASSHSLDVYYNSTVLNKVPKLFTVRTFSKSQWDKDHKSYTLIATSLNFSKCYGAYIYDENRTEMENYGIKEENLVRYFMLINN